MENPVGRLDILLIGIIERIASRNPLSEAVFRVFEKDIRNALRPLDSPAIRNLIRQAASKQANPPRKPRRKKPASRLGVRQVKRIASPDKAVEIVEAEWVS